MLFGDIESNLTENQKKTFQTCEVIVGSDAYNELLMSINQRKMILNRELKKYNLRFRSDSKLCRFYTMATWSKFSERRVLCAKEVAEIMWKMEYIFNYDIERFQQSKMSSWDYAEQLCVL